ncbi:acetyl-CoA carboxylase, carboxyltransferase subunit beta [Thermodesulfobacteriota bacterium]
MFWLKRERKKFDSVEKSKSKIPEGFWKKCPACSQIIFADEITRNDMVCPKCTYHFRLSAKERIKLIADKGTFEERYAELKTSDPLNFKDVKKYKDRLKTLTNSGEKSSAIIVGEGKVAGKRAMLGFFEFGFMGGSMGSVVGEKITSIIEDASEAGIGVVIFSSSGGARMQEGIFSLMQMAKTSAALSRLKKKGLPFISVLTDPTAGGVTASFAMLGDIIIAEPKALICFAGARVIEQTIRQTLPDGFQRAEYLLEHGMVDMIVSREDLKKTISKLLIMLT